jgi:hypothetical protein
VATQRKLSTKSIASQGHSARLGRSRSATSRLAHLVSMTTTTPSETALGPVLTLSELAGQLGVTFQNLYDLRSQGRGPRGFRVGRELRSESARSTPGSPNSRPMTPSGTPARPADAHRKAAHPDRHPRRDQHPTGRQARGGGDPRP